MFKIKPIHCVGAFIAIILSMYMVDSFTPKASIKSIHETSLLEVDDRVFGDKTGSGISYVLFYSEDSEKCTEMAYNLDQLSKKESGSHFYCMNVSKDQAQALAHQVSGVPYTLILKDGKPVEKVLGIVPVSNLRMIHERINKKD